MRVLIIPDIHHDTKKADHWLQTQQFDRAVFLGDYFDSYDDTVADAQRTALWLRQRMDMTDDIFLLGNHDAAYMFPNDPQLYCPGFTSAKARAIREILRMKHWARFQLAHAEQGWLLSHAGFHPVWMKKPSVSGILARCDQAMELARRGKVDPVLGTGDLPGGLQRFGGPLWMDWGNFLPIAGIHQIVGHTLDDEVRERCTLESRNYCLDVQNALAAAILCDGEVTILKRG